MPLLLLGIPLLLTSGALAFNSVTDDVNDTVQRSTPNLLVIGALVIAGFIVFQNVKKRRRS